MISVNQSARSALSSSSVKIRRFFNGIGIFHTDHHSTLRRQVPPSSHIDYSPTELFLTSGEISQSLEMSNFSFDVTIALEDSVQVLNRLLAQESTYKRQRAEFGVFILNNQTEAVLDSIILFSGRAEKWEVKENSDSVINISLANDWSKYRDTNANFFTLADHSRRFPNDLLFTRLIETRPELNWGNDG